MLKITSTKRETIDAEGEIMNEQGKVSFIYSWPIIILAFLLFWPIGVFLVIKRVSVDKKAALSVGKLLNGFGIASYCIAGLGLIVCLADGFTSDDITVIVFFGVAGFVLKKLSKKLKRDAEEVKKYLSIIVNGNVRQLDAIASSTDKSYDVVKTDIQKMIQKGYLKNAYINEGTREVVLPDNNIQNQAAEEVNGTNATAKIVACQCCGANNTLFGEAGECEYCGSALISK